ncbi:hypothetical protein N4R57_07390 [Rhodobacteraceae bacterium D3-12]|nr:hypothetical protein N4R57_07390 [Rhodobacteraceae bacterium D3-12]
MVLPITAFCDTRFDALDAEERRILQAEIRAVLLASPEVLQGPAPKATADLAPGYDAEISDDHALINTHQDALFAPTLPGVGKPDAALRIALLIGPNCPACARAEADLRDLAKTYDLRLFLVDTRSHPNLAKALGADTLPFYVMPRMMLRGHMPRPVLDRYLQNATGQ